MKNSKIISRDSGRITISFKEESRRCSQSIRKKDHAEKSKKKKMVEDKIETILRKTNPLDFLLIKSHTAVVQPFNLVKILKIIIVFKTVINFHQASVNSNN